MKMYSRTVLTLAGKLLLFLTLFDKKGGVGDFSYTPYPTPQSVHASSVTGAELIWNGEFWD